MVLGWLFSGRNSVSACLQIHLLRNVNSVRKCFSNWEKEVLKSHLARPKYLPCFRYTIWVVFLLNKKFPNLFSLLSFRAQNFSHLKIARKKLTELYCGLTVLTDKNLKPKIDSELSAGISFGKYYGRTVFNATPINKKFFCDPSSGRFG